MKKIKLPAKVTRGFGKMGLSIKKHSPEILMATGAVGIVASTVMACKATLKVHEIIEEKNKTLEQIQEVAEDPTMAEAYSVEDAKKDVAIVHVQTGLKFVKLYGPAVLIGTASLACMFASHKILRGRNLALAAAYATIDNNFKDYRNRVIERFGKELDRELKYNIKTQEIEETVVNEDGTETKVTKTVETVDPITGSSGYARFFDETCTGWTRDAEYNHMFLKQQQNYANELLRARGHVFLNEVYDMLGMDRSRAGQAVGWVWNKDGNFDGDGYIDFGIDDVHNKQKRLFVNGHEKSILLDFNVDGDIMSLMA